MRNVSRQNGLQDESLLWICHDISVASGHITVRLLPLLCSHRQHAQRLDAFSSYYLHANPQLRGLLIVISVGSEWEGFRVLRNWH
jgi:hypothetical protein